MTNMLPAVSRTRPLMLRGVSTPRKAAVKLGLQPRPTLVVLLRPGRDQRDVPHPAQAVEVKLHAEPRQEEAFAGPAGLRVDPLDKLGEDRAKLVRRDVVDHQPRAQREQHEGPGQHDT